MPHLRVRKFLNTKYVKLKNFWLVFVFCFLTVPNPDFVNIDIIGVFRR